MSDHEMYCNSFANEVNIAIQDIENLSDEFESVIDTEKSGDDFLIELYRERPFLYDKRNSNFKDILMKQNAWNEISKIMIETNCGDFYTPEYCQRRCTSLREQYNREKKKRKNECKSGSAAPNPKSHKFSLYSKLTFLDEIIKRRRTYSNVANSQSNATLIDKSASGNKACISENVDTSSSNKENEDTHIKKQKTIDTGNSSPEVPISSTTPKRRKMNETKELEQMFYNISSTIMNYMETSKPFLADEAFMQFITAQLNSVPEYEKNIRRKMIMDAVSTPLPKE